MMQFLAPISISKYTFPVVGFVCLFLWILFRDGSDWSSLLAGLLLSGCVVYLIAELNNRNALLRNGSRMISCMIAVLLTAIVQLHPFSVSHLLMVLFLISIHTFCRTVLKRSPLLTFITYFILSCISLYYPKILFLVPIYWVCQVYTKSMSDKCFIASLLALLTPYWLGLGYLIYFDDYQLIAERLTALFTFSLPDYGSVTFIRLVQFVYVIAVLSVGIVDFYKNQYQDKSRVRMIYMSFIIQSFFFFFLLILQPQDFYLILPLLMIYASIMCGHFFALTYTKFSHITSLVFLFVSVLVFFLSINSELFDLWNH